MTTTASAIEHSVATGLDTTELATITPVYAAVRAHRPLKGRMGGRSALFGSTIFAGAFGLFAAEAIAQQYNLPGSGGFTDVSSSINVVTDAGAGNIRVILSDGVSFLAQPGQYSLNPLTNQLQVSTDVLLGAYTGGAPVQAAQTTQVITATQAFTPPPVYAANAPLTLPQQTISGPQFTAPVAQQTYQPQVFTAGQYATQPSIVGGYQMQPSGANIAYNPPQVANLNPQPTQYVPAYSAGAQFAQAQPVSTFGSPTASTFGTAGTFGGDTFGGIQPIPVTQVVPTEEVAIAPVAAAAAGGLFGLPTWAVVGGGVAAAGAGVLALSSLGGGESTSTGSGTGSNLNVSQQAFLSDPAVQAALGNTNAGSQVTSGTSSTSTTTTTTTTTSGTGVTVSGGSGTTTTSGTSTSTSDTTTTIPAGSSGSTITGDSNNNTVIFSEGADIENIASIDLNAGDDTVKLEDVDENLDIPDLNDVENLEVELAADGLEIDLEDVGTELENVIIDAQSAHDFMVSNADSVDMITVKDAEDEAADIDDVADQTKIVLENSENVNIAMKSSSDNELTVEVNGVTAADITVDDNVDDLTINSAGDDPNVIKNLVAPSATVLEINGAQDLEIEEEIGDTDLPLVTTVNGGGAEGDLTLTLNGASVDSVTLGDGGDDLTVDTVASDAEIDTGDGNDDVTINDMPATGTVDTGDGADDITLTETMPTGGTIDGGAGSNDEITVSASVTQGTIQNVEIVNIAAGAATVDLTDFTGETDVNILAGAAVAITGLPSDEIDVGAGAAIEVNSIASGSKLTFDAAGNLTLDSDDASITTIAVDFGGAGGTLTLNDAGTVDGVTALTITSSAAVSATGAGMVDIRSLDASGSSGAVTVGAVNVPNAMTDYDGSAGVDTLTIAGVTTSATIELNAGNDAFVSTAGAGTVIINGGAGTDSFNFNGAASHVLVVDGATDVPSVTMGAAATAGVLTSMETVQNFATGVDEIDLGPLTLSGKNVFDVGILGAPTAFNNARDALRADTVDVAIYDDGVDTYVLFDAAGDNQTISVIKLDGVTNVTANDVDII